MDPGWPVLLATGCTMHDTLHDTVAFPRSLSCYPLSCSAVFGVALFVLASGLPGFWPVCGVVGMGGGLPDAASDPPPWSFSLGGLMLALPVRVSLCCTGLQFVPAPYEWTCVKSRYASRSPHRGRAHCGSQGSPCGISASLAYSDGPCSLPAAPHRTQTAVRAVGSTPGQAHWPPPKAGATSGR